MEHSKITRLKLKNFTAFEELDMEFSPGINIFIGDNGTGKTHLLKILYCMAGYSTKTLKSNSSEFEKDLIEIFLPYQRQVARIKNNKTRNIISEAEAKSTFTSSGSDAVINFKILKDDNIQVASNLDSSLFGVTNSIFIPAKELLEIAPGFLSLYDRREIHFDKTYHDIISSSFLPKRRKLNKIQEEFLNKISEIIGGQIISIGDEFFLEDEEGIQTEFTLLAEGWRKIALLWLLIQNGSLFDEDSILFWDEPESNLNPSLVDTVVELLLELQRMGVQIFIATHNYVLLRNFDLKKSIKNDLKYFGLFRNEETNNIEYQSGANYSDILPNKISNAYLDIYDKEVRNNLGDLIG